jgi:hypothetical protein
MLLHAEHCLLLRLDKLGSNLLQETLDLERLHISQQADKENIGTAPPTPTTPIGPLLKHTHTTLLSFGKTQGLSKKLQAEFSTDLLKLLVANGSAWLFANNPETHIFASKWMTLGAVIPDRKQLSRQILDEEVESVEERMNLKIQWKVGTGQCDWWKNNAKKSVVSTMVMVENNDTLSSG